MSEQIREEFEDSPKFRGMNFTRSATHPEFYESPYANGARDGWKAKAESQYTAVDMATAAADGFRDGLKSVGLLLSKGFNTLESGGGPYKVIMQFADRDDAWDAYTELSTIARLAGEE